VSLIGVYVHTPDGGLVQAFGKAVTGGVFADREYRLVSAAHMEDGFIHEVFYSVVDCESSQPLRTGHSKAEAIKAARKYIQDAKGRGDWPSVLDQFIERKKNIQRIWSETQLALSSEMKGPLSSPISFRRRKVFHDAGGKCHYCAVELTLEGVWHIEHKMPRARGGRSTYENLTAACASCNMRKHTLTADEFRELLRATNG
jgi:5-methylcytosine-specific restriction endonuclease McrA